MADDKQVPETGDVNVAKPQKIVLLFCQTGGAPILTKKKWQVESSRTIGWVNTFLRKTLRLEPNESLFLYVNQAFAPSPDRELGTLFDCFSANGKLVLHYATMQAWG
ncbi:unnamed protein product [Clavelina lepadiformis]|uniref:Ubiquitin-like protein ATG12 n=1 Tax=Clavelina lepadiformis TaxID=159417 RepID=A0ABP0FX86_CLALP